MVTLRADESLQFSRCGGVGTDLHSTAEITQLEAVALVRQEYVAAWTIMNLLIVISL